jgi:hypothetical protein
MANVKSRKSELARVLDAGSDALRKEGGRGIDAPRRAVFLRELMRSPVVGVAARRAGLTRGAVYRERERDALFRAAWDQALTGAVDDVEQVLVEKAQGGDLKAIEMVLKAHRPERYRERHEVQVVQDAVIEVSLVGVDKSLEVKEIGEGEQRLTDGREHL